MDSLLQVSPVALTAGCAIIVLALGLNYLVFFYVDIPKIQGLPEIPGAGLLEGHLYQLGKDHATKGQSWSQSYGWPAFQFRMGYRRAVMLNSFDAAKEWLVKNQSATLDRPWFYTFHGVVSKTSAATIGTNPWNERTKKQRRVIGSFTTGPAMRNMKDMMDLETCAVISRLYYDGQAGEVELEPHLYFKRLALNLMRMFCYGTRFNSLEDPMLLQILTDAKTIASFRSTYSNPQDFVPHLRYLGGSDRTGIATEVRTRRDLWLAKMLEKAQKETGKIGDTNKTCVARMLLEDNVEGLTELDIKTILGGLMSGGFETVFSTAIIATGFLSTTEGQIVQQKAFDDIIANHPSVEEAFAQCVLEEKSTYVAGLVKEALRFYPPLKILPARQVYKDFEYDGATIPKGLLFYVNVQAANFDKTTYGPDANQFRPERWIDSKVPPPYHYAFGAGGRMCTAVNFANRMLYAMFVRMILSFNITESEDSKPNTHYIDYKEDSTASNAVASSFKVRMLPRDKSIVEQCLKRSESDLGDFVTGENAEALVM